ncbi:MAG: hypothetical protein PVI78_08220 [Anaerolineales bacterium]|jgi:hypothetical protein
MIEEIEEPIEYDDNQEEISSDEIKQILEQAEKLSRVGNRFIDGFEAVIERIDYDRALEATKTLLKSSYRVGNLKNLVFVDPETVETYSSLIAASVSEGCVQIEELRTILEDAEYFEFLTSLVDMQSPISDRLLFHGAMETEISILVRFGLTDNEERLMHQVLRQISEDPSRYSEWATWIFTQPRDPSQAEYPGNHKNIDEYRKLISGWFRFLAGVTVVGLHLVSGTMTAAEMVASIPPLKGLPLAAMIFSVLTGSALAYSGWQDLPA